MFTSLPQYLRDQNLQGDVRTLLLLKKSMERGLVNTLGDLYLVLKGLVTNSQKDIGPFTVAFYQYFCDVTIKRGESLEAAILRSETFQEWRKLQDYEEGEEPEIAEQIDDFINQIHLTTYDIKSVLKGEDILNNDDPNLKDLGDSDERLQNRLQQAADFSDIPLEELLERMKKVLEQQKKRHQGGNHWVGQGGTSPYGNNGAAQGGVRVGGSGGGKMARKVIGDKNFYPVDTKTTLTDDSIDVALTILKGIQEETVETELDIPNTIKEGVKQGGLFLPIERDKIDQKVQVVLLIDNGGYSMLPYVKTVKKLFSKMKRRFAHDLKTYYFHNTIYDGVYQDAFRSKLVPTEKLCKLNKNYAVFIIGDADMAPYELSEYSLYNWQEINKHFPRAIWLNPMQERFWYGSMTVNVLKQVFEMFPMSPEGIEKGVAHMNRKQKFGKAD